MLDCLRAISSRESRPVSIRISLDHAFREYMGRVAMQQDRDSRKKGRQREQGVAVRGKAVKTTDENEGP